VYTKIVANYFELITTQQLLIFSKDKFQFTVYEGTDIRVLEKWRRSFRSDKHVLRNTAFFFALIEIAELRQTYCKIMKPTAKKRRNQVTLNSRPLAIGQCNVSLSLYSIKT
jgi:hypothetical protein